MLIKTAFSTKKTGFVFRSYQRKGFNSKKQDLFGDSILKKVDLLKTGFTSIKTVFTKSFFSVRAQRKEKKRKEKLFFQPSKTMGQARNKKIYFHIAFQESHTENWVAITTFYRGVNLGTNSRTGIGSMGVISAVKDAWILSVSKIPQSSGCLRRS